MFAQECCVIRGVLCGNLRNHASVYVSIILQPTVCVCGVLFAVVNIYTRIVCRDDCVIVFWCSRIVSVDDCSCRFFLPRLSQFLLAVYLPAETAAERNTSHTQHYSQTAAQRRHNSSSLQMPGSFVLLMSFLIPISNWKEAGFPTVVVEKAVKRMRTYTDSKTVLLIFFSFRGFTGEWEVKLIGKVIYMWSSLRG